jgi:WD40 repeat protein
MDHQHFMDELMKLLHNCDRSTLKGIVGNLCDTYQEELDSEAVLGVARLMLDGQHQRQQENDKNAFAVVLGNRRAPKKSCWEIFDEFENNRKCFKFNFSPELAKGKEEERVPPIGGRERLCTGLLAVGGDVLTFVSTFLAQEKLELQQEWESGEERGVESCHFSPSGEVILICSGHNVSLWDAHEPGGPKRTLKGHTHRVTDCLFVPGAPTVVSASYDGTLKVWCAESGTLSRTLEDGHTDYVHCIDISPDGATVLSGSADGSAKFWNISAGKLERVVQISINYPPRCCSFSPDGAVFLVGCEDGSLRLYDVATCHRQRAFVGHSDMVWSCSFAPDGANILSSSEDATMKLWNTATGQLVRTFEGHFEGVYSCAFSHSGGAIVSASQDTTMRLWTTATGRLQQIVVASQDKIVESTAVISCCFSPDEKSILSGNADGTCRLWRADSLQGPMKSQI